MYKWWIKQPMLGFDLETTGVNVKEDRIVTATLYTGNHLGGSSESWLVDPGIPIPQEATDVHGITTELASEDGRAPREAIVEIIEAIHEACLNGKPLIVFNAKFDLPLLLAEAVRHHVIDEIAFRSVLPAVIDPLIIDRHVDKYRKGPRTMVALAQNYGVRVDTSNAHTSDWDAETAVDLARVILEQTQIAGGGITPIDLHQMQRVWAQNQAISLRDYWRSRGDERWKTVDTTSIWPGV